jgi:hypothetical protein
MTYTIFALLTVKEEKPSLAEGIGIPRIQWTVV